MSSNRKALKICSFVQFALTIAALVMAFMTMQGASDSNASATAVPWFAEAILYVAVGVLSLADCVLGIRGANRPRSLGSHLPVAVVALLASAATCAVSVVNAGVPVVAGIAAVVSLVAAVLSTKVKKELDF